MDIVDRLRGWPISVKGPFTAKLCNEAADEIERLREEVKDLQSVIRSYQTGFADEQ